MNGTPGRGLIASAIAFSLALFLFGSALLRAVSVNVLTPVAPAQPDAAATDSASRAAPMSMDGLMLAVENDPFQPDRTRPAERYRMPGDVDPEPPAESPPPPPLPDFRLNGTVVTQHGGSALIQVGDAPGRMLDINEFLMGYRLTAVSTQSATMSNAERDILLRVPTPAERIAAEPADERTRMPNSQSRRQSEQNAAQVRQLLERAREAGASPQMLEALTRMIRERGVDALQNLEVRPNGFTIRSDMRVRPDTTRLR